MSEQTEKINQYSLLKHEVDTTRQLYDSMTQRVKEADLVSALKATDVHVMEAALPPDQPTKPAALLNIGFGFLSGISISALVVIQRARGQRRIEDPGETALELKVPELGVIPASHRSSTLATGFAYFAFS
jgi:succinoglycan biosynthesis transport protein ExoP